MKKVMIGAAVAAMAALLQPAFGAAQQTAAGQSLPTAKGTAVVTWSAVRSDTIPILCHDPLLPENGFVTETGDPEWTPQIDLRMWPTPQTPSELSVHLTGGGRDLTGAFPSSPSYNGRYLVGVEMVPSDGSATVSVYFLAACNERLTRSR